MSFDGGNNRIQRHQCRSKQQARNNTRNEQGSNRRTGHKAPLLGEQQLGVPTTCSPSQQVNMSLNGVFPIGNAGIGRYLHFSEI